MLSLGQDEDVPLLTKCLWGTLSGLLNSGSSLHSAWMSNVSSSGFCVRPSKPTLKSSGFHRYQFLVYEQGKDQVLSLSEEEQSSLGNWDPQAFVEKFGLVGPVASVQFLTQNFKD
ncbi:hypothetical protein HF521_006668 [Silurus meridionalis]|uniref:Phosphatidylethanolamine-binding protein 4 n=1 Tax=Silurus meridionalis TaxID=175797 RepID=A0A8T0ARE7_SILME|nr:hypothetical protein HF521_006668 [Silurus meridionalis]